MENDFDFEFDLEDKESFKINPEVWLQTLIALMGDREKRQIVIQRIMQNSGFSEKKVELIIRTTIGILINQTRAN